MRHFKLSWFRLFAIALAVLVPLGIGVQCVPEHLARSKNERAKAEIRRLGGMCDYGRACNFPITFDRRVGIITSISLRNTKTMARDLTSLHDLAEIVELQHLDLSGPW